jgi:hypothetical protein
MTAAATAFLRESARKGRKTGNLKRARVLTAAGGHHDLSVDPATYVQPLTVFQITDARHEFGGRMSPHIATWLDRMEGRIRAEAAERRHALEGRAASERAQATDAYRRGFEQGRRHNLTGVFGEESMHDGRLTSRACWEGRYDDGGRYAFSCGYVDGFYGRADDSRTFSLAVIPAPRPAVAVAA